MDDSAFDETVERLKKTNAVIENLDPAIRADAFALLRDYIAGKTLGGGGGGERKANGEDQRTHAERESSEPLPPDASEEELIEKYESDKDADNALLCLAILYKRHGRGPFSWKPLKAIATQFNVDIPSALHMTFGAMKRDGQAVLRNQADGWKVTPSGEKWLRKAYGVERGKEPVPTE
jgi:hypothetical protein